MEWKQQKMEKPAGNECWFLRTVLGHISLIFYAGFDIGTISVRLYRSVALIGFTFF